MATGLAYHYCDEKGFSGILASRTLWASDANRMNDMQEVRWTRSLLDHLLSRRNDIPNFVAKNARLFLDHGPDVFLFCFSSEEDLLSQWVRYADDGAGFAIGFDPHLIAKRRIPPDPAHRPDGEKCDGIYPVTYERKRQEQALNQIIEHALPDCRSGDDVTRDKAMAHLWAAIGGFRPLYKHPGFREENEIRYIRNHRRVFNVMSEPDAFTKALKKRTRADGEVRYFETPFPANAIKEVWIGPTCGQNPRDVDNFMKKSGITAEIKVSDIPYRSMAKAPCPKKI
jgi:hypothetical protein